MHRGVSLSPWRNPDLTPLDDSAQDTVTQQPTQHRLLASMSLPVGMQGRSGWRQYLKQKGAEQKASKAPAKTPLAGIVEVMVRLPKDLLEQVRPAFRPNVLVLVCILI